METPTNDHLFPNWTLPQVEAAEMPAIDNDLERRWPLMRILAGIPQDSTDRCNGCVDRCRKRLSS
jgi:hypothetical protein